MTQPDNIILQEFEEDIINRSKLYVPTVTMICVFICLAALDMVLDFERISWKRFDFDWLNVVMVIVLPSTGLVLITARNKVGWFISTLFFSFICFAGILTFFQETYPNANSHGLSGKIRPIVILLISLLISLLCQSTSLRVWMEIGTILWILAVAGAFCFAFVLVLFG